ncbi:DsbA family protein [uncultured Phenylobacterium sp.]|uniref:DsbA family protein n=1 Tax=uncultured Phenylobacterium sp. TaxID=349273 RepID=UPI0025FCDD9C|nr:DsbA family protein [uncultured Phenylobacterium sp.]
MSRIGMAVMAVLVLALAGCGQKGGGAGGLPDDMVLGSPTAKVTVEEYASVGCPICAKWYEEVFPAFKAKYIDTGKVKFVSKEMLVGGGVEITVAASGFLIARCAGKDKYFAVVDALYRNQQQAFQAPRETLLNIARSVGMTDQQFETCVNDEKAIQALNDRVEKHNKGGINSTPTFVINGAKMEPGYHSLEEIEAMIKQAGG